MRKVTLKDIAKELNVTIGTVSHALNGKNDISEETKKRVAETAKRLGYISNSSALSLRLGKTNTIAIIVPDISNPHISYQIKLIEDILRQSGYTIIILNSDEDNEAEYRAIVTACNKQVDGILLCPTQHDKKNIEFLNQLDIPYILIGRFFSEFDTDYVCADDYKGGYLAGKYLASKGCRRPIYIGAYSYIETSGLRRAGLIKALNEAGITLAADIQISPKCRDISDIMSKIISDIGDPCAVVAFSDLLAFEIISDLHRRNIYCPVIGFDAINSQLHLPINYVSIGMKEHGWATKAADALLKRICGDKQICRELIDVQLYEFNI